MVVSCCVKITKLELHFQIHFPIWFQVWVGQKRSLQEIFWANMKQQPFYTLKVSIRHLQLALSCWLTFLAWVSSHTQSFLSCHWISFCFPETRALWVHGSMWRALAPSAGHWLHCGWILVFPHRFLFLFMCSSLFLLSPYSFQLSFQTAVPAVLWWL